MKTNGYLIPGLHKPFKSFLSNRQRIMIGGVIFIIGSLLSFGFNTLAVIADLNGAGFWGDFQDAVAFNHDQPTQADLVKIRCPILLAPGEAGLVTAGFRNPNPKKANILVKVVVSQGDIQNYRVITGNLPVEPGDNQDFRWQITPQDIVVKNFIFTRVFLMDQEGTILTPARTDSCGVFVLNLFGLKGDFIVALMVVTGLICLVVGSVLLYLSDASIKKSSPRVDYGLYGLAGFLLISMIANLLGWWIFAGIVLLLAVLFTVVLLPNVFIRNVYQ
jgi:hypothetical protein